MAKQKPDLINPEKPVILDKQLYNDLKKYGGIEDDFHFLSKPLIFKVVNVPTIRVHPFIKTHRYINIKTGGRRKLKLKEPEAHFYVDMELFIEGDIPLNTLLFDLHGFQWISIYKSDLQRHKPICKMRSVAPFLPDDTIYIPTELLTKYSN